MAVILPTNFPRSTLATPPSGTGGLSFTVAAGGGANFPSPTGAEYFYGVFTNAARSAYEIVKIETRSTDAFTVEAGGRGADGTNAATWNTGDLFYLPTTRAMWDETSFAAASMAISALTPAADKLPYYTSSTAATLADLTSFARTILDDADAATVRATVGAVTSASPTFTGQSSFPDGSALGPSIKVGDEENGLFSPAANNVSITAGGTEATRFVGAASAVNYLQVTPSETGVRPKLEAAGSDTNIDLELGSKGTGTVGLVSNGAFVFKVNGVGSAVNRLEMTNAVTTGTPSLAAVGSDTNISMNMIPKGTGAVQFNGIVADGFYRSVQYFSSTGTWTKPTGIKRVEVWVFGGGGGGGAADGTNGGSGGGGGGLVIKLIEAASLGATEAVTVGVAVAAGIAGNTSSFGAHCNATGGGAGSTNGTGSAGGVGSSGDLDLNGATGSGPYSGSGGTGGSAPFHGVPTFSQGSAGTTGRTAASNSSAGGSGGSASSGAGGGGAAGLVIVREYF